MIGSAFIIHKDTWSCSNEVSLSIFSEPQFNEQNEIVLLKETRTINILSIFNANEPLIVGEKCQIVMLSDDKSIRQGFNGEVRSVSPLKVIINIFSKNDNISEILSNITFKN